MSEESRVLINVLRDEYRQKCSLRWGGKALCDAKSNWHAFEEINETLVAAMRQFKNNPGQEDLSGTFHNSDYSLTSFLWTLQTAIEPDRSRLHPLLDFEEHFQKCFLRRGLVIYCSLILRQLEASKGWAEPPLAAICPEQVEEQTAPLLNII